MAGPTDQLLERAGLGLLRVWGSFNGEEYSLDSRRMILLAQRGG